MTLGPSGRESWSESTAMGTTVQLCLVDAEPDRAPVLHALVAEVDAALSHFQPTSEVGRLNASPGEWLPVGHHLVAVAKAAERYRALTGGVFDPITGQGGSDRLRLRPDGRGGWEARLAPGCRLDFGAIAKGYAADLVRDRARSTGALVSLGTSSISVGGRPARRDAWRIAISSPWQALVETLGYLEVDRGSFSMSGLRGQRIHPGEVVAGHVRDPRSGGWALTDLCTVGVLSEDGMRSEALSTACLVLGLRRGLALARRLDLPAVFLTVDGRVLGSPRLAPLLALRTGLVERLRALREGAGSSTPVRAEDSRQLAT